MKCPVCKTIDLVMADRQGVEIDYCPDCRGVWLDRGELDKIIERSMTQPASAVPDNHQAAYESRPPHYRKMEHHDDHGYRQNNQQGYHKKKSWLNELFD